MAPTLLEELNEMHAFYVAAINVALTEDDLARADVARPTTTTRSSSSPRARTRPTCCRSVGRSAGSRPCAAWSAG